MKTIPSSAVLFCLLAASQKTPPQTTPVRPVPQPDTTQFNEMDTTNFNRREIIFEGRNLRIDLNRDGISGVLLQCVWHADQLTLKGYRIFFVHPYEESDLPINKNDEIPMLAVNSTIGANSFTGCH